MKMIFTFVVMMFGVSAQAEIADGFYTCNFRTGQTYTMSVSPNGIDILIAYLNYTSDWKELTGLPGEKTGFYKAERFENSILISTEVEDAEEKIVSAGVFNHNNGLFTFTLTTTMVEKSGSESEIETHFADCTR